MDHVQYNTIRYDTIRYDTIMRCLYRVILTANACADAVLFYKDGWSSADAILQSIPLLLLLFIIFKFKTIWLFLGQFVVHPWQMAIRHLLKYTCYTRCLDVILFLLSSHSFDRLAFPGESPLREGDGAGSTLFRSRFSNFLPAQGPILKVLSILGHNFFICLL